MRLKEVREAKLLSQYELAKLAGVARSQISRIERGEQEPQMRTVRKLLEALQVTPDELIVK